MGVDYFPCHNCKNIICDLGFHFRCDCSKLYCEECAEIFQKKYPIPDDLLVEMDKYDLFKCYHCDKQSRIITIRDKIKKLNNELIDLEWSLLNFEVNLYI